MVSYDSGGIIQLITVHPTHVHYPDKPCRFVLLKAPCMSPVLTNALVIAQLKKPTTNLRILIAQLLREQDKTQFVNKIKTIQLGCPRW